MDLGAIQDRVMSHSGEVFPLSTSPIQLTPLNTSQDDAFLSTTPNPTSPTHITFANLKQVQTRTTIMEGALQFEFERNHLTDDYHLMGDKTMETAQAKRARRKLLNNYNIQVEISKFWRLIPRKVEVGKTEMLSKEMYVELYLKQAKAIRAHFTLEEAENLAGVDWKADLERARKQKNRKKARRGISKGSKSADVDDKDLLDGNAFHVAMFEIADHWTDDIDAKSYANFLRKLFRRITTLSKTVMWEWMSDDESAPRIWTPLRDADLFRIEEAHYSEYQQCFVGFKGQANGVHMVDMRKNLMFPKRFFKGDMAQAREEARQQKLLLRVRRVLINSAGVRQIEQTSNAEEKHFDQEQSNVLKKISASPTSQESGLRFKKLDEIKSFWGKDDDNDNKDSEYSTDDVDSEEESQILVPISRDNNARRNNWYVDAEISEIVDEDSPTPTFDLRNRGSKFAAPEPERKFSAFRNERRVGTWGGFSPPPKKKVTEKFKPSFGTESVIDTRPSFAPPRPSTGIRSYQDDRAIFSVNPRRSQNKEKFNPTFSAGPGNLVGASNYTESLLEESQEYDADSEEPSEEEEEEGNQDIGVLPILATSHSLVDDPKNMSRFLNNKWPEFSAPEKFESSAVPASLSEEAHTQTLQLPSMKLTHQIGRAQSLSERQKRSDQRAIPVRQSLARSATVRTRNKRDDSPNDPPPHRFWHSEDMALASWIYPGNKNDKTSLDDLGFERNDKEARSNPMETASMMRLLKTGAELPHLKCIDLDISENTKPKGDSSRQRDNGTLQRPRKSPRRKKAARPYPTSNIWGKAAEKIQKGMPKKRVCGIGNWRALNPVKMVKKGSHDTFQNLNLKSKNKAGRLRARTTSRRRRRQPALQSLRKHLHSVHAEGFRRE